jgi:hypothetical protein
MTGKRVIVCTALGFVAGLICWLTSQWGGEPGIVFDAPLALGIIFNRAFIGFALGLSGWRVNWALHGVVIGIAGSLTLAAYSLASPYGFVSLTVMSLAGGVWGFLIEWGARVLGAKRE